MKRTPNRLDELQHLVRGVINWPKWRFTEDTQRQLAEATLNEILEVWPRHDTGPLDAVPHLARVIRRYAVQRCIDHLRYAICNTPEKIMPAMAKERVPADQASYVGRGQMKMVPN